MPEQSKNANDTFTHTFSGYSVWLEPSQQDSTSLRATMVDLADKCGGPTRGVHGFEPHCTLLYNVRLPMQDGCDERTVGRMLLEKCVKEFDEMSADLGRPGSADEQLSSLCMDATSYYYFPYPKSADDGRGFGCVIPMLLIENSPHLQTIHDAAAKVFPPDERHGTAGGKFTPHIALVYAPESCDDWLKDWTVDVAKAEGRGSETSSRCLLKRMIARSISIWRTEGAIDEWQLVARIDWLRDITCQENEFRFEVVRAPSPAVSVCQSLRDKVFIKEQRIPVDVERDGRDHQATHVLCWYKGVPEEVPVATGRIIIDQFGAKLGRIAVDLDYRGRGLGSRIVRELEAIAASEGATRMSLTPHHYLETFYGRLGFRRVERDEVMVVTDDCHLITMEKALVSR